MKIKKISIQKFYLTCFLFSCLFIFNGFPSKSQATKPIKKDYVDRLKKNDPRLWYADKQHPKMTLDSLEGGFFNIPPDSVKNKNLKRVKVETAQSFEINPVVFDIIQWIFWICLAVGVVFLLVNIKLGKFTFGKNTKIEKIITEESTLYEVEQLTDESYQGQIKRAKANGNFRLATRIYYLWTLKALVDKNLVRFQPSKTNLEYCIELQRTAFFKTFKDCTRYYDYLWFGEFSIGEADFAIVEKNFDELLHKIG